MALIRPAKLNGPLTLKWVEQVIPVFLFRPAMGRHNDPFHLGWESLEPVRKPAVSIQLEEIRWASAEGVVGLASILETVRTAGAGVNLSGPRHQDDWGRALQLHQLVRGDWNDPEWNFKGKVPLGFGDQLRRWTLKQPEDCRRIANWIEQQASGTLAHTADLTAELAAAVNLLLHQALLNVQEHAYESGVPAIAFSAITISRAGNWAALRAPLTKDEQLWLASGIDRVLEVAIGDCGFGVPHTLWEAYHRRHPGAFDLLKRLPANTNAALAERARLHQDITSWALAHDSTRKHSGQFGLAPIFETNG